MANKKKIAVVVLSILMLLSLSVTSLADSISILDSQGLKENYEILENTRFSRVVGSTYTQHIDLSGAFGAPIESYRAGVLSDTNTSTSQTVVYNDTSDNKPTLSSNRATIINQRNYEQAYDRELARVQYNLNDSYGNNSLDNYDLFTVEVFDFYYRTGTEAQIRIGLKNNITEEGKQYVIDSLIQYIETEIIRDEGLGAQFRPAGKDIDNTNVSVTGTTITATIPMEKQLSVGHMASWQLRIPKSCFSMIEYVAIIEKHAIERSGSTITYNNAARQLMLAEEYLQEAIDTEQIISMRESSALEVAMRTADKVFNYRIFGLISIGEILLIIIILSIIVWILKLYLGG